MEKTKVSTATCQIGDMLAEDIITAEGIKIIGRNAIITKYNKNTLLEMGIEHLMVYEKHLIENDPEYKLKLGYCENVIQIKDILTQLSTGQGIKRDVVIGLADEIYTEIGMAAKLIECLDELRGVDEYTYTHSLNTAFYLMLMAKWLDFKEAEIKRAIQCGLLHDVGKLLVPTELLNKKGSLTIGEYDVMKKHTTLGYEILENTKGIERSVKQAALLHHERIDGSGYPLHKKSEEVDTLIRMVAVADVFDAMTSDRLYKKRVSPFSVFKMFKTEGIGLFDMSIVNIFLNNISPFYTGMEVLLNDGRIAQIVHIPPHDIVNPIISVDNDYIDLAAKKGLEIVCLV